MNIVIDAGNNSMKIGVFENNHLIEKIQQKYHSWDLALQTLIEKYSNICCFMVSSVSISIEEELKKNIKNKPILFVSHLLNLPFNIKYKEPQTLGSDRIALMAAAAKFDKTNILVIDAGTCITMDLLDQNKNYLGGSISPGLKMRVNALHHFTDKLPLVDLVETNAVLIGNSTKTSILSGIINGVTSELNGLIDTYRQEYHSIKVVLTGGDANFLLNRLKSNIFAEPDFLLEGLNFLTENNT